MSSETFVENLKIHIKAGYQVLLVPTHEEERALNEIKAAAAQTTRNTVVWDQLGGYNFDPSILNPVEAIQKVSDPSFLDGKDRVLVVLKDMHNFYDSPDVRRALRETAAKKTLTKPVNRTRTLARVIVLLQPTDRTHPDLNTAVTRIPFALPNAEQLAVFVDNLQREMSARNQAKGVLPPELRHRIVQAMRGLTSIEAENCLAQCLVRHDGFKPAMIETIEYEKSQMLRRTECLTYVPKADIPPVTDLGGYDELVDFVRQRALAYTPQAEAVGLDNPRGIGLIGVPGSGKSVASNAIAHTLGLPLLEFDFSSVFGSLVGQSEQRVRDVISVVQAIDGCVLVVDEADKALGGALESSGDSGVTRRVFGLILTWLARKKDKTFVVFTMNRTKGMPPELLRKGRLDELFYVDIPTDGERRSIFEIHMRKRKVDPAFYAKADWSKFLKETDGFVGSEIEEAVKSARFAAFQLAEVRRMIDAQRSASGAEKDQLDADLRPYPVAVKTEALDLKPAVLEHMARGVPTAEQVVAACRSLQTTLVTKVDKDSIKEIRDFGKSKARPVSRDRVTTTGGEGRRGIEVGDVGSN